MEQSANAVPIVDVHQDNFRELWPSILLAVKTSSFIAVDLELSGLGNRRALNASSVEERYKAICNAAKTRSVISIGLSCFKLLDNDTGSTKPPAHQMWKYYVQTFNITTLCSEDFIVEPEALKFLVSHGFDFNKQYSKGISYYKGNDKKDEKSEPSIRRLFSEIINANRSLVLHNGLVDLIFMYQCWYADLPSTMASFAADFYEACPGGIYDTKYIAEFLARTSASYLEYVFRKLQRENEIKATAKRPHVSISFMKFKPDMPYVEYRQLGIDTTGQNTVPPARICMTYAYHGWCPNADTCTLSHNVDCILDMEGGKLDRKKKRKLPQMQVCGTYRATKKKKVNSILEEEQSKPDEEEKVADASSTQLPLSSSTNDNQKSELTSEENIELPSLVTNSNSQDQESAVNNSAPVALSVADKGETNTDLELTSLGASANSQPIALSNDICCETAALDPKPHDECTSSHEEDVPSDLQKSPKRLPSDDQKVEPPSSCEGDNSTPFQNQMGSDKSALGIEANVQPGDVDLNVSLDDNSKVNDLCEEHKEEIASSDIDTKYSSEETNRTDSLVENEIPSSEKPSIQQSVKSLASICSSKNQEIVSHKKLTSDLEDGNESTCRLGQKSRGHRAGCDAFMTGFIMAIFLARYGVRPSKASLFSPAHTHTEELVNKMYLSGKSVPFLIWKSQYTKTSKHHQEKILKLQRFDQNFNL